jgi:hypothetical protein
VDLNFTGGNKYKYALTSYNLLGGESIRSNEVIVTPSKAPSGMAAPTEVTHDLTSITLQWSPPDYDGCSSVIKYVLYWKVDYEASYVEVYSGLTLSHKVTGLRTGFFH